MTTPPPLCGGDHGDTGIDNCDACQAEVLEPISCGPNCPACRDDGREYAWPTNDKQGSSR